MNNKPQNFFVQTRMQNVQSTLRKKYKICLLITPVMQSLEKWALAEYPKVLPKSPIGKALHYIISNARELDHYVLDGRYCIDNNPIERSIRPITLGRKNWLFCDTTKGADSSAIVYTLVETAKANGLDPYRYLLKLLTDLPYLGKTPCQEDLNQFLPWKSAIRAACVLPKTEAIEQGDL
mgnify:CR=1 FL=1